MKWYFIKYYQSAKHMETVTPVNTYKLMLQLNLKLESVAALSLVSTVTISCFLTGISPDLYSLMEARLCHFNQASHWAADVMFLALFKYSGQDKHSLSELADYFTVNKFKDNKNPIFSIQTSGVTAFLCFSFIFTVFRIKQGDPHWCSSSTSKHESAEKYKKITVI